MLFPQRVIPTRFGRYAIPGYAQHSSNEALIDHLHC